MDKTTRCLLEIAGHLNAVTEGMKENKVLVMEGTIMKFYAEEIKELVDEMRALLAADGRAVRILRAEQAISQEEAASRVSLERTFISLVECGKQQPRLTTIKHFADGFDLTLTEPPGLKNVWNKTNCLNSISVFTRTLQAAPVTFTRFNFCHESLLLL